MLRKLTDGILAGIMISLGGSVFVACDNRYIGAVLFTVALLCICIKGYALFTGKVGYIVLSHKKDDVSALLLSLLGNIIGSMGAGLLIMVALPKLKETALIMCQTKLTQNWYETLIRAFFCGILMFLAVSIYREKKSIVGILFCVPVFIVAGFEHSIADMYYFALSGIMSNEALKSVVFLALVVLGNALGGMLLPLLSAKEKGEQK